MEQYKTYIKKFRIALSIFGITLVVFVMLIMQIVPQIQKAINTQSQITKKTKSLADLERKLENLKAEAEKKNTVQNDTLKAFFKPINATTNDTESAVAEEFEEILQIMRNNKIKARSVKYEADPQDDSFVKFASNRYYVCKITAEMIANYSDFENFLRDLYKHEHFLDISKIEIVPYQKNRKILLINLQLKLYAQRDPSSVPASPQPMSANTDTGMMPEGAGGMPSAAPASPAPPSSPSSPSDEMLEDF